MATPLFLLPDGLTSGALLHGRYRLGRDLGAGTASANFLGQDIEGGATVWIKFLTPPSETRERLRREAHAIREVEHDHLARLLDYFESGERCVLVLEPVDGPDLAGQVGTDGTLSIEEVAAVGRGVALALRAVHRRGLLHRGVSPSTVRLAAETRARLVDLGIAEVEGDRDYRAPEVIAGQGADARADLYGLGLTLYYALTGELPARVGRQHASVPVLDGHRPSRSRADVPAWLDNAIAQATAALPADRFASAGRLAEALTPARARVGSEVGR